MDFNFRGINSQASASIPRSTENNYFTDLARRAGHLRPDLRRTQQDFFQGYHHVDDCHLPALFRYPHPNDMHPNNMVEAKIRREIENESIRREAIMSEIKRLKMGEMSLEERIAMSAEEKWRRRYGSQENGGLPFKIGNAGLGFPEVRKPVGEKGKQKILLPAEPDENISGSKRKDVSPMDGNGARLGAYSLPLLSSLVSPPEAHASEAPMEFILKKVAKDEERMLCPLSSQCHKRTRFERIPARKETQNEGGCIERREGWTKSIQVAGTKDPCTEEAVNFTSESMLLNKIREGSLK